MAAGPLRCGSWGGPSAASRVASMGPGFHFSRWEDVEDVYILRIRKECLKTRKRGHNWYTKVKRKEKIA